MTEVSLGPLRMNWFSRGIGVCEYKLRKVG